MAITILKKYLENLGYSDKGIELLNNPCHELPDEIPFGRTFCHDLAEVSKEDEHICIVGDYDADGVTSTSILYLTLRRVGYKNVSYYIPHRIQDGYGLSQGIIDKILNKNPKISMIITCDNGCAARDAVDYALTKGVEVMVTDHHNINPDTFPENVVVVHPQLQDYPCPEISGAEVAWKVAKMVLKYWNIEDTILETYLFQLMTVSIVSDVMPVASANDAKMAVNENRWLLREGLKSFQTNPDWHWSRLFSGMNIDNKTMDESTLGFYVAPVINATGRLESAKIAVEALTCDYGDEKSLKIFTAMMIYYNDCRKAMKVQILKETAQIMKSANETDSILVLQYPIHEGLIGIVAGNYAEEYCKPCFVFTPILKGDQKVWKGSARSPESDWNCFENLKHIQETTGKITRFGGHAGAAGIEVSDENFEEFKKALENTRPNVDFVPDAYDLYHPVVLSEQTTDYNQLISELKELKPFGQGLPKPAICTDVTIWRIDLFYKSGHVKLSLRGGQEIWIYNKLDWFVDKYKELFDTGIYYLSSSNEKEKGPAEKWEKWILKAGCSLKWAVTVECDYGPFMNNVGLMMSLVEDPKPLFPKE